MNPTAFDQEFQRYSVMLQSFAYSLTQNIENSKDLFQETAYRAFKNIDKFQEDTNFKAWLMTIMKNVFINDYRRKAKQRTILDSTDNQYYLNSGEHSVGNLGGSNILIKELNGMIKELEDPIRVPFVMHHEGYKYQEIADEFELPLGTIKSRIFIARKELKSKISVRFQHLDIASAN